MARTLYQRGRYDAPSRAFLATPVTDGKPVDFYVASLFSAAVALCQANIAADYCVESFNCHVDDARNSMVRQFLKSDCTDLVFIDADVGYEADDLVKLMQYDADIVAGVYPKKGDEPDFPVNPIENQLVAGEDGLLEVLRVPTGFLRIRRKVLEALLPSHESRKFYSSTDPAPNGDPYYPIFERTYSGTTRWSGDFSFSNKARELGFKIYIDPEMNFAHSGGEKAYFGSFAMWVRKKMGIGHPKFMAGIELLRSGKFKNDAQALMDLHFCWDNTYAATPGLMMAAYHAVRGAKGPVLETGSGLTTLIMGIAADQSGGMVHALESDLTWYQKTSRALKFFDIKNVKLHYAPLVPTPGVRGVWYQLPDDIKAIDKFAIVLGDGPQRKFGREGLFRLQSHQIDEALWLFDDANDEKEKFIFDGYCKQYGREVVVCTDQIRSFMFAKPPVKMIVSSVA